MITSQSDNLEFLENPCPASSIDNEKFVTQGWILYNHVDVRIESFLKAGIASRKEQPAISFICHASRRYFKCDSNLSFFVPIETSLFLDI